MGDFPYVEWLAWKYKERGEKSRKWTDYVKAHGLANYALAKDNRQSREKLVYQIEKSWYKGKHPLSFTKHKEMTGRHRTLLKEFREQCKIRFDILQKEASFSEETDSVSNRKELEKFSKAVFEESETLSKEFVSVSKKIMQSSISVLKATGEKPCLNFSVVALGSVAKGEATPYSDLEYAFIVEKNCPYYEKLAVDSYFRIANLGETPLKCLDIEEMKGEATEGTTVGYRIDGLTANAGNIPTGNGRTGGQHLTLTLDELKELYTKSASTPFDGKPGDMSDMLSSTVLILNNGSAKPSLHEQFVQWRNDFEEKLSGDDDDLEPLRSAVRTKRLQSFAHDIGHYTFLPDFVNFAPPNNLSVKVKEDIFRYPTLLANNFRICLGLNSNYPWLTFASLQRRKCITQQTYANLKIILAIFIYIRTSSYIKSQSQTKTISIASQCNLESQLPDNMFLTLGCLLSPIKNSITRVVSNTETCSMNFKEIFQEMDNLPTNPMVKTEVYYFCGEYQRALAEMYEAFEIENFEKVHGKIRQWYPNDSRKVHRYIQLLAYLLYYCQLYPIAIDYLLFLISGEEIHQHSLYKLLAAHCHTVCGQHIQAKDLLRQVESQAKDPLNLVCKIYNISGDHPDFALALTNIGKVFSSLSQYETALAFHLKSLEIAENPQLYNAYDIARIYHCISDVHTQMSEYRKALEYLDKAQGVLQNAPRDETSQLILFAINFSLGNAYSNKNNYQKALDFYSRSEEISRNFREILFFDKFAQLYRNIGIAQCRLGRYRVAIHYHKQSLDLIKRSLGADAKHETIAGNYMNIANALCEKGDHSQSIEYFKNSIDMYHAVYGQDANHQDIAAAYQDLGNLYYRVGDYGKALQHHEKSLAMTKAIHRANSDHVFLAASYMSIGSDHFVMNDYDKALCYFRKSLAMCERIYGKDANHVDIAKNYRNIGYVYRSKGDHRKSLKYLAKELQILNALFGANSNHAEVAMHYHAKYKTYYSMGEHEEAFRCLVKALRIRRTTFGAGHWLVILTYALIFFTLREIAFRYNIC